MRFPANADADAFQRMLREFEDKENLLSEMDEQVTNPHHLHLQHVHLHHHHHHHHQHLNNQQYIKSWSKFLLMNVLEDCEGQVDHIKMLAGMSWL